MICSLVELSQVVDGVVHLFGCQVLMDREGDDGPAMLLADREIAGFVTQVLRCLLQVKGYRVVDFGPDALL